MLKFAFELFGTFVFLSVILYATDKTFPWPTLTPIMIIAGLLAGIVVSANVSGAHLNPAVSIAMLLNGKLPVGEFFPYIFGQVGGAVLAVVVFNSMSKLPLHIFS